MRVEKRRGLPKRGRAWKETQTCENTDTTKRGQPNGFVDLKVTSMGKFHTTEASPVPPFCATCEKPWSMPCRMRHSGP